MKIYRASDYIQNPSFTQAFGMVLLIQGQFLSLGSKLNLEVDFNADMSTSGSYKMKVMNGVCVVKMK